MDKIPPFSAAWSQDPARKDTERAWKGILQHLLENLLLQMAKSRTIARTVIQIQYVENCPNGLNTFSVIWQDDDRGDCDSPIWNSSPCLTASYHGYHGAVQPSPRSHRSTSQANPAVYMQCWWGLNQDQLLVPSCLSGIASSNIFRGGCVVTNGSNSCQPSRSSIWWYAILNNYSTDSVEQRICRN